MILKDIKILLQNICKNNFVINTILKIQILFDIVFIQESSWSFICLLSNSKNCKVEELVRVSNHTNWINFSRNPSNIDDSPRVIIYINIRLSHLCFLLQKDILNHRNVFCVSFFNHISVYSLINVYSDSLQLALKYLKDTEVNINNVLIMTGNFNIRDCSWDPNFRFILYTRILLLTLQILFT